MRIYTLLFCLTLALSSLRGQGIGPNTWSGRLPFGGGTLNLSVQYEIKHTSIEEQLTTKVKIKYVIIDSYTLNGVEYNATKNRGNMTFPYTLYKGVSTSVELLEGLPFGGFETQSKDVYSGFNTTFLFGISLQEWSKLSSAKKKEYRERWRGKISADRITATGIGGTAIADVKRDVTSTLAQEKSGAPSNSSENNDSRGNASSSNSNNGSSAGNARQAGGVEDVRNKQQQAQNNNSDKKQKSAAEQHKAHVANTNNSSQSNKTQQNDAEAYRQRQEEQVRKRSEQARAEQRRQAEEQKRQQEYQQFINQQNQQNAQVAASAAAGAAALAVLFGKLIYGKMGYVPPKMSYDGRTSFYWGHEVGYSMQFIPSNVTPEDVAIPLNFDYRMKLGMESKLIRFYGFGQGTAGMSPLITDFQFPAYFYGGHLALGIKNLKGFVEYERGYRSLYQSYWYTANSNGTVDEGENEVNIDNLKYGLSITWGQFLRHNLNLGVTYGKLLRSNRYKRFGYENHARQNVGYFIEWHKDYNFKAFLHVYPNYGETTTADAPTSSISFGTRETGVYVWAGFHRAIDWYSRSDK